MALAAHAVLVGPDVPVGDFGAVRVLVSLHASHLRAWHQLPLAWGVVAENGCLLGFFPGGMRALDLIHAMKNR